MRSTLVWPSTTKNPIAARSSPSSHGGAVGSGHLIGWAVRRLVSSGRGVEGLQKAGSVRATMPGMIRCAVAGVAPAGPGRAAAEAAPRTRAGPQPLNVPDQFGGRHHNDGAGGVRQTVSGRGTVVGAVEPAAVAVSDDEQVVVSVGDADQDPARGSAHD